VRKFLPKVKADLAYFDPPYGTEFSAANCSANCHVVALMVQGEGRGLRREGPRPVDIPDR
jgi:adenine-specific DNA-methyltransferase